MVDAGKLIEIWHGATSPAPHILGVLLDDPASVAHIGAVVHEVGFAYLEQVKGQLVGKTADLSEPAREWLSHAQQALTEMSPLGRRVQRLIAPIGGKA